MVPALGRDERAPVSSQPKSYRVESRMDKGGESMSMDVRRWMVGCLKAQAAVGLATPTVLGTPESPLRVPEKLKVEKPERDSR